MIHYLRAREHACQNTVYHHMVFFKGYVRCWRPGPTVRNAVSSSSPYYRLSQSGWRSQTCLLSPHRITQHEIGPLVNGQKVSSLIYRGKCIAVQYMLGSLRNNVDHKTNFTYETRGTLKSFTLFTSVKIKSGTQR